MRTTIHFEGMPGSGKTTASKHFYKLLCGHGIDATLCLEEASNHPIMPKKKRALSRESDYPQICLDAWLTFYNSSNSIAVLDGYSLQSTVRFLYANQIARVHIEDYFNKWQVLAPETTLVYLFVENPREHFDVVLAERGDDWSGKLYRYVERSPIGLANSYYGKAGFIEFWAGYQQLCLELLGAAYVPVHVINSRSWGNQDFNELAAQLSLLPERL